MIDAKRIYLTGISDGGTGVWDTLKTWPACFAAAVPMSGMTELAGLDSITAMPQWIFHGEKDNDTDIEKGYGGAMVGSRAVVRELRALGANPKYSEYAEPGARDLAAGLRHARTAAVDARQEIAARRLQFCRVAAAGNRVALE